jgi:hypothetical protein
VIRETAEIVNLRASFLVDINLTLQTISLAGKAITDLYPILDTISRDV